MSKRVRIFAARENNIGMKTTEYYVDALHRQMKLLQTDFDVRSLSIFGSVARRQQVDGSDIDVCVDMPVNPFRRLKLKEHLEQTLGCKVDVIRMHPNMNKLLSRQIETDGIRIF